MDDLHPLLRTRSSPARFDAGHEITEPEVALLVEAARWAPSAGNAQPWSFVVAPRATAVHDRLVRRLAPSAARWAPDASVLVVNVAHAFWEDSELAYSEFADYDLGQAVAHMTVQAQAMGLASRQFRAFDLDALSKDLAIPAGWQVRTMTAIGRPLDVGLHPRDRREHGDLILPTDR
ncbi:nitroreductase family protein [Mumia sp. DW29H23]|uniref:nitroreductase family protein n=1 Tax=Mumia sp. DW29H23 TaxID=3421241 RepID=UPI003D687B11